jgi:hypothetical protein
MQCGNLQGEEACIHKILGWAFWPYEVLCLVPGLSNLSQNPKHGFNRVQFPSAGNCFVLVYFYFTAAGLWAVCVASECSYLTDLWVVIHVQ